MSGGGADHALALIRRAIAEERCLEGIFDGHRREFCPHVLGTKHGDRRVLCFQYGGGSSRGLAAAGDWRCLSLAGLTEVAPLDEPWHTRPHSHPQTCIDEVELEVRNQIGTGWAKDGFD